MEEEKVVRYIHTKNEEESGTRSDCERQTDRLTETYVTYIREVLVKAERVGCQRTTGVCLFGDDCIWG